MIYLNIVSTRKIIVKCLECTAEAGSSNAKSSTDGKLGLCRTLNTTHEHKKKLNILSTLLVHRLI